MSAVNIFPTLPSVPTVSTRRQRVLRARPVPTQRCSGGLRKSIIRAPLCCASAQNSSSSVNLACNPLTTSTPARNAAPICCRNVVGSAPPAPTLAASWPGDDAMIQRYVETQTEQRTAKLVAAIGALGHTAQVVAEEGENAVADILAACRDRGADILIVGTHGRGRFEGLLGSVSTKLSRSAGCSVLLVR